MCVASIGEQWVQLTGLLSSWVPSLGTFVKYACDFDSRKERSTVTE